MGFILQRDRNKPVTVAVLVPASEKEKDGWVSLEHGKWQPVRVLKPTGLDDRMMQGMNADEREGLLGLLALFDAIGKKDKLACAKAAGRLAKSHGPIARKLAKRLGAREELLDSIELLVKANVRVEGNLAQERLLCAEATDRLGSARLGLWWTGKRFMPGIYCSRPSTALFVFGVLGKVVGGKTLVVCPHCQKIFWQKRPNQYYCSVAHREAHRVARWRAAKKERGIKRSLRRR